MKVFVFYCIGLILLAKNVFSQGEDKEIYLLSPLVTSNSNFKKPEKIFASSILSSQLILISEWQDSPEAEPIADGINSPLGRQQYTTKC